MQRDLRAIVLERLARWRVLGQHHSPSGALLIGHLSQLGSTVWLHKLFPAIERDQADEVSSAIVAYSGSQIAEFHRYFNGINLFSSNFYLLGRRTSFIRSPEYVLPWDIVDSNQESKSKVRGGEILIGGSDALDDGIDLVEHVSGGIVAVARQDWGQVLFRWQSLEQCLIGEIDRLSSMFDETGAPLSDDLLPRYDLVMRTSGH